MSYKDRVTYYIKVCHLDIWDAVREATEDARTEEEDDQAEH